MKNKTTLFLSAALIFILLLSACQPEQSTSEPASGSSEATESAQASEALHATEIPQAPAASSCPVGTWNLTDGSAYFLSLLSNLTNTTDGEYTFKDASLSGDAQFVFNEDQTAVFSGDNFTESVTMVVNSSDSPLEIPIIIEINGNSTSKYTIEGDKISYSDQDNGDLTVIATIFGSASPLDMSFFGEPGTTQLYQFACSGTDTLTLKVIAINDMDLEPLVLTRAQ